MGMPVTVAVSGGTAETFEAVFGYFDYVDRKFSTFKKTSEISKINRGEIFPWQWSPDMREVFALSEETRVLTDGYFNIQTPKGTYDPSGLVKGWAIRNAAKILEEKGFEDFYVDVGGDIQSKGKNAEGEDWSVGIRNPFDPEHIVKRVRARGRGVATSGTYERGEHIYDPLRPDSPLSNEMISLTVIGPDIYEADRFATAAFAMGKKGMAFIQNLPGFEGYAIDRKGMATMTEGFAEYVF